MNQVLISNFLSITGLYVVNELESKAYSEKKIEKPLWEEDTQTNNVATKIDIPEHLKCPVCKVCTERESILDYFVYVYL